MSDELQGLEAARSSWLGSPWLTILIFILIAHFNPEILTGSTRVEAYLRPVTLLGMLFYGLQVAVIADVAARYRLRWRTIYVVGLIYGILEEGFAVQTMLSPNPPEFVGMLRVLGLDVTWTVYIMIFHATVSVLCSVLIVRVIWPSRVSRPFLRRRHYAVVVPAIAAVYAILVRYATAAYPPEPSALLILAGACLALALLARNLQRKETKARAWTGARYLELGLPLLVASALVSISLGGVAGAVLPVTLLLLSAASLFGVYFGRMDGDPGLTGRKQLTVFAMFIVFWLVLGAFFRTPLSNVVAFAGVALQLYLGWGRVRTAGETRTAA